MTTTNPSTPPHFINISHLNTMALSCHAQELFQLTDIEQILPLFRRLAEKEQEFVIISNGSNIILPPVLHACVITPNLLGQQLIVENDDEVIVEVMAGELWHEFVVATVNKGWYGLENLALIPSWVGASPIQNIGAYGVQVEDMVETVKAFHIPTLTWHILHRNDCQFGYRDSRFKRENGDWLIASVTFRLHKNPSVNIQYGDVAKVAQQYANQAGREQIMPVDTMNAIIQIRQSKIPETNELPNCGSFFKNPIVDKEKSEQLLQKFPNMVNYPVTDNTGNLTNDVKLAGGWLIEHAGLKGKGIDPIKTHIHQALVLTNHQPHIATQADVEKTMNFIQQTVKEKFGVMLEPEPVWVNDNGTIRKIH